MSVIFQDALKTRIENLGAFNGIRLALVELRPQPDPTEAVLSVHFFNDNELSSMVSDISADPALATDIFPIMGGNRILAGSSPGQVQVVDIDADPSDSQVLHLNVQPIGDYSTYTLGVVYENASGDNVIDPLLSEVDFKFRPGCFNNTGKLFSPVRELHHGHAASFIIQHFPGCFF